MSWILHIDGDSFFASVETSLNPALRGRAVVTGEERGIATAMSKEAKKLGVHRGMPVFKIRQLYPEVVIVKSDYLHYRIFAQRMYDIVRRYSDRVEEYSIDECFALLRQGSDGQGDPIETARKIKYDLQKELGMTFSIGLGPTKVIAKVASKWNKPDGFIVIRKEDIPDFLRDMQVGKIWGIGPSSSAALNRMGIKTALDLVTRPLEWIRANLDKRELELWYELNGQTAYKVHSEQDDQQASIQKTRTFPPPPGSTKRASTSRQFLLSELSKNVEHACKKLRKDGLVARHVYFFLKTQEFRYHRHEFALLLATDTPQEILKEIVRTFDKVYQSNTPYRATGVTLSSLIPKAQLQKDLFNAHTSGANLEEVYKTLDTLDKRFGRHTVILGSSLQALKLKGTKLISVKRLRIPYMGEVV